MVALLSTTFGSIPALRQPERVHYRLHDTLMRGFAMMFFQHASLLECQRKRKQRRGRCHLETIFGGHEVPSDTQMREILDGVPPEWLRQGFPALLAQVCRAGWGKAFTSTVPSGYHQGDYYSARRDGRDYFHSTSVQCPGCLQRVDANGDGHFRHTGVSATLVKAGSHRVLPLDVEAGRHSAGHAKQDGAVHAAKRLIPRLRQEPPQLPFIIGGDALYGHEPFIAQLRALRLPHGLVCQPTSPPERSEWVEERERWDGCDQGQWHEGPACRRRFYTYRIARSVP
jgi:hypothetical protein